MSQEKDPEEGIQTLFAARCHPPERSRGKRTSPRSCERRFHRLGQTRETPLPGWRFAVAESVGRAAQATSEAYRRGQVSRKPIAGRPARRHTPHTTPLRSLPTQGLENPGAEARCGPNSDRPPIARLQYRFEFDRGPWYRLV